jgi:hypothetical protein
MKYKFEVGDCVVWLEDPIRKYYVHDLTLEILRGDNNRLVISALGVGLRCVSIEGVILFELYGSPLYKALREEK